MGAILKLFNICHISDSIIIGRSTTCVYYASWVSSVQHCTALTMYSRVPTLVIDLCCLKLTANPKSASLTER